MTEQPPAQPKTIEEWQRLVREEEVARLVRMWKALPTAVQSEIIRNFERNVGSGR